MVKLPSVSIVIPAYNEEKVIQKCLESCIDQTDRPDEIIVVNNNSTDDTVKIVRRLQRRFNQANIRLLTEKQQGIIPARNKGFTASRCQVIGRIDADSIIQPDWVHNLRRLFVKKSIAAATGPVEYYDMPLRRVGLAADKRIRKALYNMAKDHTFLFGSNMAIRKSAWEAIKDCTHMDEEDVLHEDIDLALCLFRNNLKSVYEPNLVGGMSARRLEDSPRDFYNYVMRFERTFKIHEINSRTARIPIFIYILIYFPVRTVRKFYDDETNKFTWNKLREDLEAIRKNDS